MLTPQALECVAWISNQQAMSKKLLALAFLNFKQFGNRLAWPVSMVYNGRNQWQTDDAMSTGDLLCGSYDPAKRSMALRLHL